MARSARWVDNGMLVALADENGITRYLADYDIEEAGMDGMSNTDIILINTDSEGKRR